MKIRKRIGFWREVLEIAIFTSILIILIYLNNNTAIPTGYIVDTNPEFEWQDNCENYNLKVDNNKDFDTLLIDTKLLINHYKIDNALEPGIYYWKVDCYKKGQWNMGKINMFEIRTIVSLSKNNGSIKNEGNVEEKISFFENGNIIGNAILKVNEILKIKGDEVLAEEN